MTDRQKLMALIKGDSFLVSRLLLCAEGMGVPDTVKTPSDAAEHFRPLLFGQSEEHFAVLALDRRHTVIGCEVLTKGNDSFCIVDPRQVFSWALRQGRHGAAAIMLAHNHPSGNVTPSVQDSDVTRRVQKAGQLLGITLLDHLIFGGVGWLSMKETGYY